MATQEKPELLSSDAGLGAAVAAEHGAIQGDVDAVDAVRARGYWEQVWRRLRRDKVAIGAAIFIVFLVLAAFPGATIAANALGHTPEDIFLPYALDERQVPVGPMTNVAKPEGGTTLFILGADSTLGRDAFLRLLYGARVSLEVALLSTIGGMSSYRWTVLPPGSRPITSPSPGRAPAACAPCAVHASTVEFRSTRCGALGHPPSNAVV